MHHLLALALSFAPTLAPTPVPTGDPSDQRWPNWRGPTGDGIAAAPRAPLTWSEDKNVRWKVALPGLGSSTPIVWDNLLVVTTAIPKAAAEAPEPQEEGRRGGRGERKPNPEHEFVVMGLSRKDGSTLWRTVVAETVPHESIHQTNSQASASPITDGEHIIAFFGSRGLHGLDMSGKLLWSKDLGRMKTRNEFGEGASPALHGDTVVVVWDHEGDDFIAAFDKQTGEERWRKQRDEITAWSTPLIVPVGDRAQVITTATGASRAYDLATGEVLWSIGGMTSNCIPTPIHRDGVVYLMSGFRGAALQAIRLDKAQGELGEGHKAVLWRHGQETSYVPSGVLVGEHLYFLRNNTGVLSCLEAATGKVLYSGQKLTDVRSVYSSLTCVGEHIYIPSREGATVVFQAGPLYKEVAVNLLEDTFDASPVAVGGELYLRGWKNLYCIAEAAE